MSVFLITLRYSILGIEVSPIQFLPVVMLQLFTHTGEPTPFVYNVEPYMQGNFEKLTNNSAWVNKEGAGTKLVLSFRYCGLILSLIRGSNQYSVYYKNRWG